MQDKHFIALKSDSENFYQDDIDVKIIKDNGSIENVKSNLNDIIIK